MEVKTYILPIRNIQLSLNDVNTISRRLVEAVDQNAETRIKELKRPEDWSQEKFEAEVSALRKNAFRVTVTISGKNGERIFGNAPDILTSANLPSTITSVFFTNNTAHETAFRFRAPEFFSLLLDFSKPPLLDGNNPVSSETPNNSNLSIEASQEAWIGDIQLKVKSVLDDNRVGRFGLHLSFVYDFLLWAMWIPLSVYLCFRISPLVSSTVGQVNIVLEAISYTWLICFSILVFRCLFGYTKWAFPTVELKENSARTQQHRRFWYAIMVALIGTLLADIII
jgi:hypothetical protein